MARRPIALLSNQELADLDERYKGLPETDERVRLLATVTHLQRILLLARAAVNEPVRVSLELAASLEVLRSRLGEP